MSGDMIEDKKEQLNNRPAYIPLVEAISPPGPSDDNEVAFSCKERLVQLIKKIDREMSKVENSILRLKKKEQELAEASCQPNNIMNEDHHQQPDHQSLAQKIYSENRRKAQEAHLELEKLGQKVKIPLYNQPSDTAMYHKNKRKYILFKERLVRHLCAKKKERQAREENLVETYSRQTQEWHNQIETIKNSDEWKTKEAENRELFEKEFPELKKKLEDRDGFNRLRAGINNEAELKEVMNRLQEQEIEDQMMRARAVIPPLLLDAGQRQHFYINNNGKIRNFTDEYKKQQMSTIWSALEKKMFKEKFLQYPKNFVVIASYLKHKSVSDCVQFYYHSKKEENYKVELLLRKEVAKKELAKKELVKKSQQRIKSSRNGKVNSATDLTTHLQREQLQKQVHLSNPQPSEIPSQKQEYLPKPQPSEIPPSTLCDSICDNVDPKDNNASPAVLIVVVTPPSCRPLPLPLLQKAANDGETMEVSSPDPLDDSKGPQLCVVCKRRSETMPQRQVKKQKTAASAD